MRSLRTRAEYLLHSVADTGTLLLDLRSNAKNSGFADLVSSGVMRGHPQAPLFADWKTGDSKAILTSRGGEKLSSRLTRLRPFYLGRSLRDGHRSYSLTEKLRLLASLGSLQKSQPRLETTSCTHFIAARSAVSSLEKSAMFKGVLIALLALLFLALCDQYWSGGRNNEAAFGLARQIRQSFGV